MKPQQMQHRNFWFNHIGYRMVNPSMRFLYLCFPFLTRVNFHADFRRLKRRFIRILYMEESNSTKICKEIFI